MAKLTVDGVAYTVQDGRTVLQALDDAGLLMNGVTIPHYCWHPKLSIGRSWRLCQVEIQGQPKLQIACNTPVADGMVVHTEGERVRRAREGVMELLLVNHPLDCPICDQPGECKLQDYAYEYGLPESSTRSSLVFETSSQKRTQRRHRMQRSWSNTIVGPRSTRFLSARRGSRVRACSAPYS